MVKSGGGLDVVDARVHFGALAAVDGVDLRARPGEITALVGPSGCGKSTLLRFISGLESGGGTVCWDGMDLTAVRPDRRHFGLMFQDHALFPNRNVAGNIEFGLRMAKMNPAARRDRIVEMLDLVGLAGYERRAIDTLSGGEAQRVALARSLAPSPRLLMLDEPLGSLDRELRERLAVDLREILTASGVAAILVTHDQEEAYAVADRLAVMRAGRIVRAGSVASVWSNPATVFTARFLGHRNVLDQRALDALGIPLPAPDGQHGDDVNDTVEGNGEDVPTHAVLPEAAVQIIDRADDAMVPSPGVIRMPATVSSVRFRGSISQVDLHVATTAGPVWLRVHLARPPRQETMVEIGIDPSHIRALSGSDPAGH